MKPRVMFLVVFTALVGLVAAPGSMHPILAIAALICIVVGAGASGALNMWYDADIDAAMARTAARPIPRGRVTPSEARSFGSVLAFGSVVCGRGQLARGSAARFHHLLLYFRLHDVAQADDAAEHCHWRRCRRAAADDRLGRCDRNHQPFLLLVLFLIIFVWTPPHFWALALLRTRDYERAGVPMLPVVSGEDATRLQILIYSLILAPLGMVPAIIGLGGTLYAIAASVLGALFVVLAYACYREREGEKAARAAKDLFAYSVLYLFLLFAVLLVEQGFNIHVGALPHIWTS